MARLTGEKRWPLGDPWEGTCHADPGNLREPGEAFARTACNLGYARGACSSYPVTGTIDARRYTLSADTTDRLTILYSEELDHQPAGHGTLDFVIADDAAKHPDPLIVRQCWAYAQSYLRRKSDGR
jgi:hypothetical protein